jgi:lipopolysaccharide/colanic/teichoic acid biosynthesis glycosyltransferase
MARSTSKLIQSKPHEQPRLFMSNLNRMMRGAIKRVFDITAAFLGLLVLSPVFGIIAILIKRDSPGPVFYWGPRIGKKGVQFRMLKFRTMYEDPKSYRGPRVTSQDDDRITPIGKWLRDTKLNEFPQLWNVLIGEMSLVGPRPEDPAISRTWPTKIAHEILSVRPGITSPASVLYRDEESMLRAGEVMQKYLHELSPDKMRLDQLYVRYQSFWLDLDVVLWTALLLLPKIKAISLPERLLFVGPVTRLIQRYVGWFLCDFVVVWVSYGAISWFVNLFRPVEPVWSLSAQIALAFALLFTLVGLFLSVNRINWAKATTWEIGKLWVAWIVATVALMFYYVYLGVQNLLLFGIALAASLLSFFGILAVRYNGRLVNRLLSQIVTRRLSKDETRERVLIVGSGRTAEHISWLMDHPTYAGKFQVVGVIDDNLMSQGMNIYGSRVIGRVEDIQRIVKNRNIDLIILADNQMILHKYSEFQNTESFSPARVVVSPDIFGSLSGLDGGVVQRKMDETPTNFLCRHCLVRHSNQSFQAQTIQVDEPGMADLVGEFPQTRNEEKWKTSGQKRKSS